MESEAVLVATEEATAASARSRTMTADLVALGKPRITLMVLVTTLGGMFVAPTALSTSTVLGAALGTVLIVAGANGLNMYIERESDRFMTRTADRPLPSGRMAPRTALVFGILASVLAVPILGVFTNPMATMLAVFANASYVFLYTPLKARSWTAVLVGAVPGAIPPLLGWTAAMGTIDLRGLSLFAILFFWQIPHFHAIALFRKDEYARAGLYVLPNVRGVWTTKRHIVVTTALLVGVSFAPHALKMVSFSYVPVAMLLGTAFFTWAVTGLRPDAGGRWARTFFAASMPYLVLVFASLLVTRV